MKKLMTFVLAMAALLTACNGKAQSAGEQKNKGKVLVAYFSCTGNTQKAAEAISKATGATLYRITPKQPYTDADLDWQNANSRSSVEMKDPKSRPELADLKADVEAYDTIFVGYPIWWGVCPTIVNTFFEAYDFKGKKVIPFATSGSSSIDRSETALHALYKDIRWGKGLRVTGDAQELDRWLEKSGE